MGCTIGYAGDVAAQVERRVQATVGMAQEVQIGDAEHLRRGRLLLAAQGRHVGTIDRAVRSTGFAIGDDAVHDVDALLGPGRDRSGGAEVDVVGVGHTTHSFGHREELREGCADPPGQCR